MANQRMAIRCMSCGKLFHLAKRMGGGYYLEHEVNLEFLADFLSLHTFCNENHVFAGEYNTRSQGMLVQDIFELAYEGQRL